MNTSPTNIYNISYPCCPKLSPEIHRLHNLLFSSDTSPDKKSGYTHRGIHNHYERYYEEQCLEKDMQIQALRGIIDELSRKLYEENPSTYVSFDIKDLVNSGFWAQS